ncbi:MAG TPA: hypothetical protein VF931_04070 [Steroidobacteraceae bacterium]
MPEPQLPSRSASVSDLMDAATRIFRSTLAKCLPVALFAILFSALPNMYWLMTTGNPVDPFHPPLDPKFWTLSLVGFAFYQLLAALLMLRQRAMQSGRAPQGQSEFAAALARWPLLILSSVLAAVAVFAGAFALLLPGIYLLICVLLLRPVVLFETLSPLQVVVRCIRLVRPLWWKVLAAALIAALIFLVCAFAASLAFGIVKIGLSAAGVKPAAITAFAQACGLGIQAVALVYFSALWLVIYSAASSSA